MERNKRLKENRAKYIKERLDKVKHKPKEIKRLSEELFVSERTIREDYKSK